MAWRPISGTVPQYHVSGEPASGYYLKGYIAGTTTPLNMASDSTGAGLLAKCQLNSDGYPLNGSVAIFVPHFDQDYKLALYSNATDADADATGSAIWFPADFVVEGVSQWQSSDAAIYVNTTTYRYENIDKTANLHIGQRVYLQGGADRWATIKSFSFSTHTDVVVEDIIDGIKGSTLHVSMTSASLDVRDHNATINISTIADLRAMKQPEEARFINVTEYFAGSGEGGGKFHWDSSSTAADDGGVIIKPTAVGGADPGRWIRLVDRALTPSDFGAQRDVADYSTEIQACFDYCATNNVRLTGTGTYYTAAKLTLNCNFDTESIMQISTTSSFATGLPVDYDDINRRVLILNTQGMVVKNLVCVNSGSVTDIVGVDYGAHQIKTYNVGAAAFAVNNLVRDFSISIYEGQGTAGGATGKGLVAYAPNSSNEINALNIYGGEWFGNQGGAIDIGDRDGLFTTTIAPGEFFGNGVYLHGYPTMDQGFLSVDRVINFKGQIYAEEGGVTLEAAVKVGGAFNDSVRGFEISGYARDYDYFVKCLGGVSGIFMHNCHSRTIRYSALYLLTDQYTYRYQNNTSLSSFTGGQEVHTGVRSGISGNAWATQSIDIYGLSNGIPSGLASLHVYPGLHEKNGNYTYKYDNVRYRYYKSGAFSSAGTVAGTTFTFSTPSEAANFNAGDAIKLNGGATSYLLYVDYAAGTAGIDTPSTTGAVTMAQQTGAYVLEGYNFQAPTPGAENDGSVVWNIFTVSATPQYWIRKSGAWVNGTP